MACDCVFKNAITMAIVTIFILIVLTWNATRQSEHLAVAVSRLEETTAKVAAAQTETIASLYKK